MTLTIFVPADVLVPEGTRPSAGTALIMKIFFRQSSFGQWWFSLKFHGLITKFKVVHDITRNITALRQLNYLSGMLAQTTAIRARTWVTVWVIYAVLILVRGHIVFMVGWCMFSKHMQNCRKCNKNTLETCKTLGQHQVGVNLQSHSQHQLWISPWHIFHEFHKMMPG